MVKLLLHDVSICFFHPSYREKMVLLLHFLGGVAKWLHREDLQKDKGCSLCPEDHDILWEGVEGEKRGLDKSLVFINKGSFEELNPAAWKDIRGHQTILTLELSLLMKTFLVAFDCFLHTLIAQVFQCVTGEVSPSDVFCPLLLQGGCCENGVTARIGKGTGSQESEFFISLFLVGCLNKTM